MPTLESVTFDTSGLEHERDREGVRVWYTSDGDGVGLYFFPTRPDVAADITSPEEVRRFYRESASAGGATPIEVDTLELDGCQAIRSIMKIQQTPSGWTYVGSITLTFRDFSFVVKAQCEERGTTGMREAIVVDQMLRSGRLKSDHPQEGWMVIPEDATGKPNLPRSIAEGEEYDHQFQDHPLSRVRRILGQIQGSLRVVDDVKAEPPFVSKAAPNRRWWQLW